MVYTRGSVAAVAKHQYGCWIIRLLIEFGIPPTGVMYFEVLDHVLELSHDRFGIHVIEALMNQRKRGMASHVVRCLAEQLSMSPIGDDRQCPVGYVIERALQMCFEDGGAEHCHALITALVDHTESWIILACSRFGHSAVLQALNCADSLEEGLYQRACAVLLHHSDRLNSTPNGRRVVRRIAAASTNLGSMQVT